MTRSTRQISARARILGAILAVACIGLAIVGSVTFLVQRDRMIADVDDGLIMQVERLRAFGGASIAPTDGDPSGGGIELDESTSVADFLGTALDRLTPQRDEASLAIIDGTALPSTGIVSGVDLSQDSEFIDRVVSQVEREGGQVTSSTDTAQGSVRYIAVPVSAPGDAAGVYVYAVDLGAELDTVTAAVRTFWVAAIAVLLAIGGVGWFVMGRVLSPIRDLRDAADAITIGDLSPRLSAQGNDDISDMTRTVNSMLDRLESSVDVQRQLLDDVRHELKTPITIVRGHLEMMDASDVADVQSTREIGIAELDRMNRLVDDIDLLATVEGDEFMMREVDLTSLTTRVGELVAVIPDHAWSVAALAHGRILGDEDRLVQAWLQLADNASKYTAAGTSIQIGSEFDGSGARLWVRDHGPGIPHAARHRIFRRFDRAHGKRSVGGSGLGLAIVDAITKGHGGHCAVTDTDGGGATFTIHLPLPTTELPAPVRAGDVVLQREASG